jgi:cytochrome c
MKHIVLSIFMLASTAAFASADLAKSKNCLACHAVDKKLVGPSFKDIASKYKSTDAAYLTQKIKKGGSGVWGPIPMPANPQVTDAEAAQLAGWVLKQK